MKTMKKVLSVMLVAVMLLTAAPLSGFVGLEWPEIDLGAVFAPKAEAYESQQVGNIKFYYYITENYDTNENEAVVTGWSTDDYEHPNHLSVPSQLGGYPVTEIDEWAFSEFEGTSVYVPGSVRILNRGAFGHCNNLTSVVLEEGVENIGYHAFLNATSLQEISLPDSITTINEEAFHYCSALKAVKLPASLESLEDIFPGCTALESIDVPDNVTRILYCGAPAVKSITFGENSKLEKINILEGAFTSLHLPAGVEEIDELAFMYCPNLETVTFDEDNETYVGIDGVIYEKDMETLCFYLPGKQDLCFSVPDTVEKIENRAFYENPYIGSISIPASVRKLGYSYYGGYNTGIEYCDNIYEINVAEENENFGSHEGVLYVKSRDNTFTQMAYYPPAKFDSHYTVPETVTIIGSHITGHSFLTSIELPLGITRIVGNAYTDPNTEFINLMEIYYPGSFEQWIANDNDDLTGSAIAIHYNSHYTGNNTYTEKYPEVDIETLILSTRNAKSWAEVSAGNDSLLETSDSLNWKMANSKAKIGDKTFLQVANKNIHIQKMDLTDDIILTHSNYYNYIIPLPVAQSFMGKGLTNVAEFTAYMRKEIKNGKPYVSTVFARQDETETPYIDICREPITIADDNTYTFYITADNLKEKATYYISQDQMHKIESETGVFTLSADELKNNLQNDKPTKIYFVTESGVISDPVSVSFVFENIKENKFVKELSEGKLNILGKEGFSITLPEDWLLIGGSTIDLCDWSFPIGLQVEGNEIRVSVGFDLWTKTETTKTSFSSINKENGHEYISKSITDPKTTTLWENVKNGLKGSANAFKNAKDKAQAIKIKKQLCNRYGVDIEDLGNSNVKKTKTNVSALGYIEGQVINGKFIVTDMLISVAGEFTLSYTYQMAEGYMGLEGGGKITVSTNWSRFTADTSLPLEFGFSVNFTPWIKARFGVGWDGLASAGLYGKGTMPVDFTSKDRRLALSIIGEFGYEGQFLIWKTGEKVLIRETYGPLEHFFGKSSVERARTLQAHNITTEDVGTSEMQYTLTQRKESSAWWGENQFEGQSPVRVGSAAAADVQFKTLQSDVYDLSDAKIITAGDTTLAAWIAEAEDRDDYNRLQLVYSVFNPRNNQWSEPKAVYSDGFMDAAPALTTDGETIFIAWQKYCKTFTAENSKNMDDVRANAEIYTAQYDLENDSFINVERLTNNSVYDYNPALTVKDGNAVTVFATDRNNAAMSADSNSITKVENGIASILAEDLSSVSDIACAVIDNEIQVAFSADTDGNLQTVSDISVLYGTDSFTAFEKQIPDEAMSNFVYAEYNGKMTLFVSDGTNIYYMENGEIKTVLEEDTVISSPLQAVKKGSNLCFYWLRNSEEGMQICTCSQFDDEWSNAVCIAVRSSTLSNLAVTTYDNFIFANTVYGIATESSVYFDEETQSYQTGSTNLISLQQNVRRDLKMVSVGLDESNLENNGLAFLEVLVENNGTIKDSSLTFTVSDNQGNYNQYLVKEDLLPGKSLYWRIPYTIPEDTSDTVVTVSVSCEDYADMNNENNSAEYAFDKASLLVTADSVVNSDGICVFTVNVANKNFTTADRVVAKLSFDAPESEEATHANIGKLTKDTLSVTEFALTQKDIPFDEEGVCLVYVTVTADNAEPAVCSFSIRKTEEPEEAFTLGDIDNDGNITSSDARTALRAAVGLDTLTEVQKQAADVNKDGTVTSTDARSILRCAVGLESF